MLGKMRTNYPSMIGLTYFDSEIEAVSLCEGESAALVELRSSSKSFVPLPAQALELPDIISRGFKNGTESQQSSVTALDNIFAMDITKLSLRPGETFTSGMPRYSGHTSASVRLVNGVQLDLQSEDCEGSSNQSSVQITALPNSIGTGNVPTALHMPTQDNSRLRIVLHKGAELSYPFPITQQGLLPLVVERSTAAIQARHTNTPRLLKDG